MFGQHPQVRDGDDRFERPTDPHRVADAAGHGGRRAIHARQADGAVLGQSRKVEIALAPVEPEAGVAQHDRAATLQVAQGQGVALHSFAHVQRKVVQALEIQLGDPERRGRLDGQRQLPAPVLGGGQRRLDGDVRGRDEGQRRKGCADALRHGAPVVAYRRIRRGGPEPRRQGGRVARLVGKVGAFAKTMQPRQIPGRLPPGGRGGRLRQGLDYGIDHRGLGG